jgi:N-acetylglucosaminyldiphosphoundecaprenol N-acetyl-beta-D-mannosaminyltransferase
MAPAVAMNVLGVRVDAVRLGGVIAILESWIERGERSYVCLANVHGIMESRRDSELKAIYDSAGLSTPDGMPLVWMGRLRGFHEIERVYGPDLMLAFCQRSEERGYRHFLYGGGEGVADRLESSLKRRFPRLRIVGRHTPPFRELTKAEDDDVVRSINASGADVVWVGLGTGKQDRFMRDHLGRLEAPVLVGVGAAFDFVAGTKRQAPLWMRRSGLEWLFRLASEPRRLGRRYVLDNPEFLWRCALQAAGLARYEEPAGLRR